jgi:hypothetical protein
VGCWEAPGEVVDGCDMNALSIHEELFSFRLPTLVVAVTIRTEGSTILLPSAEGEVTWRGHMSSLPKPATYDYQVSVSSHSGQPMPNNEPDESRQPAEWQLQILWELHKKQPRPTAEQRRLLATQTGLYVVRGFYGLSTQENTNAIAATLSV